MEDLAIFSHHLWSGDGVECLFCCKIRWPEEIDAWIAAGKPDERCYAAGGGPLEGAD